MKNIQINYLSHNYYRLNFSLYVIDQLKKIENKNKIKLNILSTNNCRLWENKIKELLDLGIDVTCTCIQNGIYMNKINYAINSNLEYSCKMDDDILINHYLWDYIIENINVLNNKEILFLTPLISNGIPTTDLFIESFMNDEDKKIIYDIFLKTEMPKEKWGVDYSSLNECTINTDKWDYNKFYDLVNNINHYYKGIHPVRLSYDAHKKIAEVILDNFEQFMKNNNYNISLINRPYFCNSFFFIKTNIWKNIVNNKNLFVDPFDEVPLSLYMQKNKLFIGIIDNGFCLHMAYNTLGEYQHDIENLYFKNILK